MCCGTQGQTEFEILKLVGAGRFELPASASRTRRATRLRYAPMLRKIMLLMSISVSRTRRATRLRYAPPVIL